MRVGVKRNRADFVLALEGGAVQRLDVGEQVAELDAVGRHLAARQPVVHERVVGIRTMGDGDFHEVASHLTQLPAAQQPSYFLLALSASQRMQRAEVGGRGAEFLRRHLLDHLAVGGRAVRHGAVDEVVLLGEELERGCPAVDVDLVEDAETVAALRWTRTAESRAESVAG